MNKQKTRSLLLKFAKSISAQPTQPRKAGIVEGPLVIRGDLVLEAQSAKLYYESVDQLHREIFPNAPWGKSFVDSLLAIFTHCIVNSKEPDQRSIVEGEVTALIARVHEPLLQYVIETSVVGLAMDCDGLKFGKLTFVTESVKDITRLAQGDVYISVLFARVLVEATDEGTAAEIGDYEIDSHLAVLNAVCSDGSPSSYRVSRGHEVADRMKEIRRSTLLTHTDGPLIFRGRRLYSNLNKDTAAGCIKHWSGDRIETLLTQSGTFADRLVSALATAGAATVERKPQLSFLLFAIALESAVLDKKGGELGYQLRSRVAHLLSSNPLKRPDIARDIQQLYDRRSEIVHKGQSQIAPSELYLIRMYCLLTLKQLCSNPKLQGMERTEELGEWFNDCILGITSS